LAAKASATENYYPCITNTVPVEGWVKKLIVPKSSANLLLALVSNDEPPKATDEPGLHTSDISGDDEAIDAYRKAIQLDPDRAVAYLNLGDCLRELLSVADSFEEKISLTKEIKLAYMQYKKLHGKSIPVIDSFLALNLVDTPITDFCEYVAAYTNQGRLRGLLLLGSGTSVKKRDDQGSMQVEIAYEGSGHYPHVYFIDSQTGQEIEEQIPDNGRDTPLGDEIDIVPFLDGHHLLDHTGDYLVASAPIGLAANTGKSCGFNVRVTESWDKKGTDTELCRLVLSPRRPSFISFEESNYLNEKALEAAGYPAGWAQEHGSAEVDFDNDGRMETLVRLDYASTAGPGCSYDFFDLLNEEKNGVSSSKRRSLLLKMQGIEHGASGLHPVPHCRGNVTGWFRYKGTTYFETKYPEDQPQNPDQEFHTVSYIKNGKIHKICDARFKIRTKAEQGHEATPKRLRKSEPELSVNDKLLQAAGQGNLEAVPTLLAQGGDLKAQHPDGRTVLMQAVLSGNLELVRFLIDEGADVNAKDEFGTALMYAAKGGHIEIMKLLLDKGADLNATDKYGHTALLYAARSGNLEAVKLFIDKGADVKAKTDTDESVLLGPAGSGNLELLKLLVDKGADVHAEGAYGATALLSAASQGNLEVMKFLIDRGVDVRTKNQKGDTALISAASRPKLEVLHFLIDRGVDVNAMNKYGDTALMGAAGSGNLEAIKLLIDKGADVNATGRLGQTPLKTATAANRLDVMKLLIDKGADVNGKPGIAIPPIIEAVKKGNLDLVKFLLNHGADVNAKDQRGQRVLLNAAVEIHIGEGADADDAAKGGETALMAAASSGNLEFVKFLIDKGADVHAKDLYGGTVLMSAASQPKIEVLKFFIDKGLDVKTKNNKGDTTLMSAASHGNLEVMKFLVDRGVDVNAANKDGGTALTSVAGSDKNLNVYKFLIDRGADVNAKSKDGVTALMRNSTAGNLEALKFLIDKGADVNAKGEHGESALLFATIADRLEAMKLLVNDGADVNGQGSTGYTPLMEAARSGHLEGVKFLINNGADVNARDERGRMVVQSADLQMEIPFDGGTDLDARTMVGSTALMAAVEAGNLEVVKVLIAKGADINVRCRSGETALSLASADNKPEIAQYLQAHGAKLSDEPPRLQAHGAKPSDEPPPLPPIGEKRPRSR
jgi:ankyrin repeat protein